MTSRRKLILGFAAGAGVIGAGGYFTLKPLISPDPAPIGFTLASGTIEKAVALLKKHPAVDVHAHPGRTFVHGASDLTLKLRLYTMLGSFEQRTIDDMKVGYVSTAGFSGVADFPVLDATKGGLKSVRDFHAGEAWNYYKAQLHHLRELVEKGWVEPVNSPEDIRAVHKAAKTGMFLAMEGGDFLEEKISRVQSAFVDGLRMLTLVHYNNNAIGDIITDPVENGGLSDFGHEVVGEMNRLGIIIDLSHASERMAKDTVSTARKPICLTHTHVRKKAGDHPRFVSGELAKSVVDAGGIIGAWPAGIGISTLSGFIDRIVELVREFGENGVAIGSDMDANYKPVYGNFRQMPLIVGALLERGLDQSIVAKIIGGNFIRVFEANHSGRG